jgi:hypothetical protein
MWLIVPGINSVRAAKLSSAADAVTLPSSVVEVVSRTAAPAAPVTVPDAFGKPFSELPFEDQATLLSEAMTGGLGDLGGSGEFGSGDSGDFGGSGGLGGSGNL